MKATITLREYLEKGKTFVIPEYQRGYVWGRIKSDNSKDSVTYIMEDSLIPGFKNCCQIFIQGITVCERDDSIVLIDGQQRTTFFYLLLKYLGYGNTLSLRYNIREESGKFLSSLSLIGCVDYSEMVEEFQDIWFFKKTLRIIDESLRDVSKTDFLKYILDNVKFLYIDIPEDKAVSVFTMMNGNKALMKDEELIKAELLRLVSLQEAGFGLKDEEGKIAREWDCNMLRSRYAREWDKWLQWWNRDDVKRLFKHDNVMGYLISSFLATNNKDSLSFENFKSAFLKKQTAIEAKKTFDGLRRLQKRFEDAFKDPIVYNKVGAILRVSSGDNGERFLQWYFVSEQRPAQDQLDDYYRWAFLNLTYKEIIDQNEEAREKRFDDEYQILSSDNLYIDNAESAFRLLLRLNIDEDNLQNDGMGRKFDFSIWDRKDSRGRSLEHIFPKSKVWHEEKDVNGCIKKTGDGVEHPNATFDDSFISREKCTTVIDGEKIFASEHSVGNLVLLYKDDNSSLNASSFEDKKDLFFKRPGDGVSKEARAIFKSRHLLHTIYKFASSKWDGEQIAINKYDTLRKFKEYYGR